MIQHNTGTEIATLDAHQSAVADLVNTARTHRIVDDATRGMAADIRNAIKTAEKRVEEARTSLVKPLNDHVKSINARFKPLSDQLDAASRAINVEILRDHQERQEAARKEAARIEAAAAEERRRQEAARAEEARLAAEKAAAEAKAAGMTEADAAELGGLVAGDVAAAPLPPVLQVVLPPPPPRTIASTSGAVASVKKVWDFEVTDLAMLAAAMPGAIQVKGSTVLDEVRAFEKLHGAKDAETCIPGVRAFKRDQVSG